MSEKVVQTVDRSRVRNELHESHDATGTSYSQRDRQDLRSHEDEDLPDREERVSEDQANNFLVVRLLLIAEDLLGGRDDDRLLDHHFFDNYLLGR